jgi:hypothetical protein
MPGNPDSDNRPVGLNLILIGSGHPDIRRRLNDGRGLRYHDRRGLSDHDRGRSHNYRSGIGHNHRARSNRIVDRAADKTTDDTADKSATVMMPVVVMVAVMVMYPMMMSAVRTGETCSGAESDRKHQRYCLELVHILPFPFSAFWRYIRLGNAH